jgi:NAD+ synthase
MMPFRTSSPASLEDAGELCRLWNVPGSKVEITPQVDAYFGNFPDSTPLQIGNKCARERMSILYDFSSRYKALVIGTSNKSELLVGYSTQFGDSAASLLPIADLYKTQVWQLSRFLEIPEKIVAKNPTADLWPGQTDEGELGISYRELDEILLQLVDLRLAPEELISRGCSADAVARVIKLIKRSQFKRVMPPVIKISGRTCGLDFRYPRDWDR